MDYNYISLPCPGSLPGSSSPPFMFLSILLPPTPNYWHSPNSLILSFSLYTFFFYGNCLFISFISTLALGLFSFIMPFFAQRPNCLPLGVHTPWLDFKVLDSLFPQLSTRKFSSNQKSLPTVFTLPLIFPACGPQSSCRFHTHNVLSFLPTTNSNPLSCKCPYASQPPPTGLPWLCQGPESSPALYSKLTIICSVHLTCLKNQFLWELVNIN